MKMTCLFGAGLEPSSLLHSFSTIKDILQELGCGCDVYFHTLQAKKQANKLLEDSQTLTGVLKKMKDEKGLIIAFDIQKTAPAASILSLFETIEAMGETAVFKDKNVLFLTAATDYNQNALQQVAYIATDYGAFDAMRIFIPPPYSSGHVPGLQKEQLEWVLEKYTEDFYRILRQDRLFFGFKDMVMPSEPLETPPPNIKLKEATTTMSDIEKKYKEVEKAPMELAAISKLYQAKIKSQDGENPQAYATEKEIIATPFVFADGFQEQTKPRPGQHKTLQGTKNLVRYYNPQGVPGLEAVFEFSIAGAENFHGFIDIAGNDCHFVDGEAPVSDIKILSDALVWRDVLEGKITAQKAFMTGQLKVRGNFVLLTQFDQIFPKS